MSIDTPPTVATAEVVPAAPAALATPKRGGRSSSGHVDLIVKRAVRRGHDDDHGGSWKIAFADFCLALMCLFLLLWVLGARDEEEARLKLGEMADSMMYDGGSGVLEGTAVLNSAALPDGRTPRVAGNEADVMTSAGSVADTREALHALAARVRALAEEAGLRDNLQAIVTPMGLRIVLHDTDERGVFVSGGATPSEPFQPVLTRLGELMGAAGNSMLVIGHTDSVPYRGTDVGSRSNWHLSGDRAMSARRWLLEGGMASRQVLQVVGMADRAPLANDPRAPINRRIEFLMLTPERARTIQTMFGRPEHVVPLTRGVNAASAGESDASRIGSPADVVPDGKKDLTGPSIPSS
ncbi:flagellar motor protein MotB [Burkholderia sp. BCC0044]|uniref:flagellar motor protein MotB n=1 Tax=Burkholderia sp. BCC0044 TaxID=2676295 RepID=UPI00158A1487|nr:flagellar motor protein MotB [Burkholderia sp. BCC0044]